MTRETETNNILKVENFPLQMTEEMLSDLFSQYPGFKYVASNRRKIKLIPGRGIAFVEYDDDLQACLSMKGLNGFKISPQNSLVIAYAKLK